MRTDEGANVYTKNGPRCPGKGSVMLFCNVNPKSLKISNAIELAQLFHPDHLGETIVAIPLFEGHDLVPIGYQIKIEGRWKRKYYYMDLVEIIDLQSRADQLVPKISILKALSRSLSRLRELGKIIPDQVFFTADLAAMEDISNNLIRGIECIDPELVWVD